MRETEARKRLEEIELKRENDLEEFEQELSKKSLKVKEFEQMMAEKRRQLIEKEEEYNLNREEIMDKLHYLHEKEISEGLQTLETIDKKCKNAETMKFKAIRKRTSNVQKRNQEAEQRMKDFYRKEKNREIETAKQFVNQRLQMEKKLNTHARETRRKQEMLRTNNRIKSESSLANKKFEDVDTSQRLDEVMTKMKQSQDNIDKFKEQKEHEFYLRRELRRLKEEDFRKMQERKKRLEYKKYITD